MKAAIIYSGKFGSTRQYAQWLGEVTGLPVFDIRKEPPEPWFYDLLILGTSVIVGKPTISGWIKKNWHQLRGRKLLLFSVSGTAPGHPDLPIWMYRHLGEGIMGNLKYLPLRGSLKLSELPWWVRLILKVAAKVTKDPDAKKRMSVGFDHTNRNSLEPIFKWYREQTRTEVKKQEREVLEYA